MDQAKQVVIGKWCVLDHHSIGELMIMEGIGGTLTAQIQYLSAQI